MAFLDNSGDIILDAVLTDVGRKRMASGQFSISKFSIGDDEIDYGLYNKDHPSGSAYYDLEILQTPILEAFTQINANINYGLVSYARQDLLYLPSIELNQKSAVGRTVQTSSAGVIYVCDTTSMVEGIPCSAKLSDDQGGSQSIMQGDGSVGSTSNVIFIETGISTVENSPVGSSTNQSNYILGVGLADNSFTVAYDSRYISTVYGPSPGDSFSNTTGGGAATLNFSLIEASPTNNSTEITGDYVNSTTNGVLNRVYYTVDGSGVDLSLTYSAIAGPRASWTVLGIQINPDIPQDYYNSFGRVAQTQGGSTTYDYIDTVVYVNGASTNVMLQLPIRIIKLSS